MHSGYKPYFLDRDGDFYVGVHPFFIVFSS